MTVAVPRNGLEDDCIGVYKPMFQDLAHNARRHSDKHDDGTEFTIQQVNDYIVN